MLDPSRDQGHCEPRPSAHPSAARRRFTKPGRKPGEVVLRHVRDALFGTACRFLDLTTRRCTVYEVRPRVCRRHPSTPTCHYYAFLMAERRHQHDPRHVTRAYNIPGEW